MTIIIPIGTPAPSLRPFAWPYFATSPSLIGPDTSQPMNPAT